MSQAGIINTSSGPVPPVVATSYVTDVNSPAIPAANVLNVLGGATSTFDIDGIRTDGSSGGNTLTVQLTNVISGSTSTVGAANANIITLALGATPGTFTFDIRVAAFNASTPAGGGYQIFGTVRTTGVAASVVGTPDVVENEDAVFAAGTTTVDIVASANNAIVQVSGTAGLTINWVAQGIYTRAI